MDRRSFVAALAAAPLAACVDPRAPLARPGLQLYTVRDAMATDVDGTLAALASIGYREVELAGTYGLTPAQFRTRLDNAGLRAVSGHVDLSDVRGEWQRTLDGAAELGQELIVIPWLPEDVRDADSLRAVADDFNRAGEASAQMGLRLGYHNHEFEFESTGGVTHMAVLLDETDPALVDWQMDIYWTVHAGQDPLDWLNRYSGRVTSVHIKDRTPDGAMVDVGDGVIDFSTILRAAEPQGLRYGFIEHDFPEDPVASVRRSFEYMMEGGSR